MSTKDISIKQVQGLLMGVYKRYKRGTITETTANKEAYILNSILKTIEMTDLEERMIKVEALFSK